MDARIVLPQHARLVRTTQAGLAGFGHRVRLGGRPQDYDTDTETLTLDVNVAPAA